MSSPSSASSTTPVSPASPTSPTRSTRSLSTVSSTSAPRHWHGSLGDRYEHHNVWVRGGLPQVYMPEKMNSTSSESGTSSGHRDSASSPSGNNERRRSSASALFSGLSTQKRNPMDSNMNARRQSWKDQESQGGWFSKWWDGYTKG